MITSHLIGEITLSISSVIYCVWFIPQIWENFQRKSTDGLSLWMHGLLFLGYSIDLMYGFGRHMQWQYCLVTIVGLIFLFIQHYQFARYDLKSKTEYWNFAVLSCLVIFALLFSILNITVFHHNKWYYDKAGYVETGCYFAYVFPQIIKNYCKKSTLGLSRLFVTFSILLGFLDFISALTLHWDLPSLLMPSVDIIKKLILVLQMMYYAKKTQTL
ncbi:MAG TPA: PQ-loop repeat-containing protein [Coxiellaceae bacterium]|nr:PQ-loop repeat-containing protein [Coxiellaceae bacterium]